MDAIKFIAKWTAVFIGGVFVLNWFVQQNIRQDQQAYATFQKAIAEGRVISGMTPAQVEQAWGKPSKVTRGVVHGVAVEQWIYAANPPRFADGRYVGFREGEVVIFNAGVTTP